MMVNTAGCDVQTVACEIEFASSLTDKLQSFHELHGE